MSRKSKNELIDEWNWAIQQAGTMTVLHTNAIASRVGLSATEFEAIDVIRNRQPITAGELAVACGLTTGAITGLIDRLVASGYVVRKNDPNDRRKVLLEPKVNSKARRKVGALYAPMSEAFNDIANTYTVKELELLLHAQRQMNEMVNKRIALLRINK